MPRRRDAVLSVWQPQISRAQAPRQCMFPRGCCSQGASQPPQPSAYERQRASRYYLLHSRNERRVGRRWRRRWFCLGGGSGIKPWKRAKSNPIFIFFEVTPDVMRRAPTSARSAVVVELQTVWIVRPEDAAACLGYGKYRPWRSRRGGVCRRVGEQKRDRRVRLPLHARRGRAQAESCTRWRLQRHLS